MAKINNAKISSADKDEEQVELLYVPDKNKECLKDIGRDFSVTISKFIIILLRHPIIP